MLEELVTAIEPADSLLVRSKRIAEAQLAPFELGDDLLELGERLLEGELFGFGFFLFCHGGFALCLIGYVNDFYHRGHREHRDKKMIMAAALVDLRLSADISLCLPL
jgi:hypothetical protein